MNCDELNRVINESGMKRSFIAESLGMSDMQFYRRTHGETAWKYGEVQKFCKLLKIGSKQREDIFFA